MMREHTKIGRVMDHGNTQTLYRYWNELRAGRDAPCRSEVDPRRISDVLETMFILELLDEDQLRFRLAGTALCRLLGLEARGMTAETIMTPRHGAQLCSLALRATREPGVGVMRVRGEDGDGVDWPGEMLLLPLRSELGEMSRVMGCINLYGRDAGHRPTPGMRFRCQGARLLPIDADPAALHAGPDPLAAAPAHGFAEGAARFDRDRGDAVESRPRLTAIDGDGNGGRVEGGDAPKRDRGHLRLVED